MNEDEEDYEELPPITVNLSARESENFLMPRADELASQRMRELECEEEILRLRKQHATQGEDTVISRSESSESEGEAALAAAVAALMRAAPARGAASGGAGQLAAALAERAPPAAAALLRDYANTALRDDHEMMLNICSMVATPGSWSSTESLGVGAWLCCVVAAGGGGVLGASLMHHLLQCEATATSLQSVLLPPVWSPENLLTLSDALRAGPPPACKLADRLVDSVAVCLLGPLEERQAAGAVEARWRSLDPRRQYAALQTLARIHSRDSHASELPRLLAAAPSPRDTDADALENMESDSVGPSEVSAPSAEQLARAAANRARARALKAAKRAPPPPPPPPAAAGGFLPEPEENPPPLVAPPPAPVLDPSERPNCINCGLPFAQSYLFDTFEYAVCDECKDETGAHELVTRTEAKSSYLLQDADLDCRGGGPLRCVRRRNPHARHGDMRLYLRAQVEERALLVWGSEERLEEECARRAERRERTKMKRGARALRALRMDVRSSLFKAERAPHKHVFGPETYDDATDLYTHECSCGHKETYEKM